MRKSARSTGIFNIGVPVSSRLRKKRFKTQYSRPIAFTNPLKPRRSVGGKEGLWWKTSREGNKDLTIIKPVSKRHTAVFKRLKHGN